MNSRRRLSRPFLTVTDLPLTDEPEQSHTPSPSGSFWDMFPTLCSTPPITLSSASVTTNMTECCLVVYCGCETWDFLIILHLIRISFLYFFGNRQSPLDSIIGAAKVLNCEIFRYTKLFTETNTGM